MKNNFKKILALFLITGCGISQAVTDVFFINKTPYTLKVKNISKIPKNADAKGFSLTYKWPIRPQQTVKLMTIPRGGVAMDVSTNYYFYINITGLPDNKILTIGTNVNTSAIHGPAKTSSIKATGYITGMKPEWVGDDIARQVKTSTKIGSKTFALSLDWLGLHKGSVYHDVEFTLQSTGEVSSPNELTLLQYNIQQRPAYAALGTGKLDTARNTPVKMPSAITKYNNNIDVVTIDEAFARRQRPKIIENMEKYGFTHHTNVLGLNSSKAWSGGVMVFSKYPIVKTKEYIYKNYSKKDGNAAKGVLYAQINKDGKLYNIFATHTNASYTFGGKTRLPMDDEGRLARKKQFVELKKFIDQQNIPSNQPVIIVGDMNVDMISENGKPGDEYHNMLETLNATHPRVIGGKYTLDRNTNVYVDPNDGPPQYLDYALYSNSHQKPQTAYNRPVCLKASGKDVCKKLGYDQEISDHYPLFTHWEFSK